MPDGVQSERSVKNHLNAARKFFIWCADQQTFAWSFPSSCGPLLTAASVRCEPMAFDPDGIVKIIRKGGRRVRMFALFGLTCGFYQADIADTLPSEFYSEGSDRFLKRFRSKEARPKRGSVPVKVRHWISPSFGQLIESERYSAAVVRMFASERGVPLTRQTIGKRWQEVCGRVGANIPFKQLRKMGYNAIKRIAGSRDVAELWAGHAGGVTAAYDDGIFDTVNQAERLWADELRQHDIL